MLSTFRAGAFLVVATLVVGCGDGDPAATGDPGPGSAPAAVQYATFAAPGWELGEAVHVLDRSAFPIGEPGLQWWAEYDLRHDLPGGLVQVDRLRLSGHAGDLDAVEATMPLAFERTTVGGAPARWREAQDGDPSILLLATDGDQASLMLLSYELDVRTLADHVVPTTQDGWIAAGGRVVPCYGAEPPCVQPLADDAAGEEASRDPAAFAVEEFARAEGITIEEAERRLAIQGQLTVYAGGIRSLPGYVSFAFTPEGGGGILLVEAGEIGDALLAAHPPPAEVEVRRADPARERPSPPMTEG